MVTLTEVIEQDLSPVHIVLLSETVYYHYFQGYCIVKLSSSFSVRFKRSFIAGLAVVVPLLVAGFILVWLTTLIEGFAAPVFDWAFGRRMPGLGFATALLVVTSVGLVATTVLGRRVLHQGQELLSRVPIFKDIYVPVKLLIDAFSPENEAGFKKVVFVHHPKTASLCLGFLTREFVIENNSSRPTDWAAVYIPTNHLYLGDVFCIPREQLIFPQLSVEEGATIVLTGGTSFPDIVECENSISSHSLDSPGQEEEPETDS